MIQTTQTHQCCTKRGSSSGRDRAGHSCSPTRIFPRLVDAQRARHDELLAPRVLFYTASFHEEEWTEDFNSLSPELIQYLHEKKVILVGIDTASIDPARSKDIESHSATRRFNIAVLEGIVLGHVQEGIYTLIALPLKIKDGDASPVRAVLLNI
jgi:arylformamidase